MLGNDSRTCETIVICFASFCRSSNLILMVKMYIYSVRSNFFIYSVWVRTLNSAGCEALSYINNKQNCVRTLLESHILPEFFQQSMNRFHICYYLTLECLTVQRQ